MWAPSESRAHSRMPWLGAARAGVTSYVSRCRGQTRTTTARSPGVAGRAVCAHRFVCLRRPWQLPCDRDRLSLAWCWPCSLEADAARYRHLSNACELVGPELLLTQV